MDIEKWTLDSNNYENPPLNWPHLEIHPCIKASVPALAWPLPDPSFGWWFAAISAPRRKKEFGPLSVGTSGSFGGWILGEAKHIETVRRSICIYIYILYINIIYIYIHAIYTYTILWIPLAPKIIGMLKTSEDPIWPCAMPPGQARGGSHFPWWPQRQCPGVSGTGRWFVCLSGCCPQWSGGYVSS